MIDPNENRPGYQKTKVGWVPVDWHVAAAAAFAPFVTSGSRGWADFYADCGDLFMRITNLRRDTPRPDLSETRYVKVPSSSAEGRRTLLQKGDLLVSITADLGIVGYVFEHLPSPAYISQHLAILRFPQKVKHDRLYLAYSLAGEHMAYHFYKVTDHGAKAGLNLDTIRELPLILPPLPEQQKIAEILSIWDDAIEQTAALIESKRQQKKALMQQLLSGHRRLPGFTEPLITERLKAHIVERHRRCKTRTDLPILSVTNDRGFVSQDEQFGRRVASTDVSNYKVVKEGEFAYNPSRVNVGSLDMLRNIEAGLLSPMYVVFSVKETALEATYLRHFCDTYSFAEQVRHLTQGSVRDSLSFEGLAAIKCLIPSLREQRAIAAVLAAAEKEIASLVSKLEALRQQKKGLMQRLLTGQVRVKTA